MDGLTKHRGDRWAGDDDEGEVEKAGKPALGTCSEMRDEKLG